MTALSKNEPRPFILLLVGQGKLATHVAHYLSQKKIQFFHWHRSREISSPEFQTFAERASLAWILVVDRAIHEVAQQIKTLAPDLPLIHSSAATDVEGVLTLHPLQTFGPTLYPLKTYENTPFVLMREEWEGASGLKTQIKDNFKNPLIEIPKSKRGLYHAYCVMMANFPQMLWDEVMKESNFNLHQSTPMFEPILRQATENFIEHGSLALTGPLVRGDRATLSRHQDALSGSKLLGIYQAFVKLKETV
jgi:predicted short-subunit dehydrogenase-like oxidoreductase (DUF2520 family)